MTTSRLFPLLSLLPLLSLATAIPLVAIHNTLNPSDLCPLIDILEHELCSESSYSVKPLCTLLQKYNATFCSSHAHDHDAPHTAMSNDALSVRVLHNEYYVNKNKNQTNAKDIHKVCPIINFIEQELCSPTVEFEFDPKELCPLLNLTYTEFCA